MLKRFKNLSHGSNDNRNGCYNKYENKFQHLIYIYNFLRGFVIMVGFITV